MGVMESLMAFFIFIFGQVALIKKLKMQFCRVVSKWKVEREQLECYTALKVARLWAREVVVSLVIFKDILSHYKWSNVVIPGTLLIANVKPISGQRGIFPSAFAFV